MVERILGRDSGRVPMRLQTTKNNNRPNICSKANTGLSATLFNLVLHKALKNLEQSNTNLNRLTQICGYANDILVTSRSLPALEALWIEISREAGRVGLAINPKKTKYEIFNVSIPKISERGNHKWCNL